MLYVLLLAGAEAPGDYISTLFYVLLYFILLFLPLMPVMVSYYIENRNDILITDPIIKSMTIKKDDKTYHYKYSDIAYIEKHLSYVYGWRTGDSTPVGNIGYIKFKFTDGNIFYFTAMMLPPRGFNIGVPIRNVFRVYPYIKRSGTSWKKRRKIVQRVLRERIELFKGEYGDHSLEQLTNGDYTLPGTYKREAITAIKELIKEKQTQ